METKAVELEVVEDELAKRREEPREFGGKNVRGILGVYQQTARPVHLEREHGVRARSTEQRAKDIG